MMSRADVRSFGGTGTGSEECVMRDDYDLYADDDDDDIGVRALDFSFDILGALRRGG